MSTTETTEDMSGTKPIAEHEWLRNLVGDWKVTTVMSMPDGSTVTSEGTEKVEDLGGLWAFSHGEAAMPDGSSMIYKSGTGYDVSFKGYRGFMIMSMSSHLWKYEGTLSADGKTLTMDCVGPDMETDGKTANYRDIIEIVDADHRTMTSTYQDKDGNWETSMKSTYERV